MNFYRYWAKSNTDGSYHLLPYHSLDVAACGRELLKADQMLLARLSDTLGFNEEETLSLFTFLLAHHDFGKFSRTFQNLKPELVKELDTPTSDKPYRIRHDTLGQFLWRASILSQVNNWMGIPKHDCSIVDCLVTPIFGHHGSPPDSEQIKESKDAFQKVDHVAAREFSTELSNLFPLPTWPGYDDDQIVEIQWLSWAIAGWAVVADWLGSNQKYYPFESRQLLLEDYWNYAQDKARLAVADTGNRPKKARKIGFSDLFPEYSPTPLQEWAGSVELDDKSLIFILEDATGAGKTEAALTLASRIMSSRGLAGVFVALPTTATANQMYDRTASVYRRLYCEGEPPSLVLAHGRRNISDKFRKTIGFESVDGEMHYDPKHKDETAASFCKEWMADSAKKSLLADVGVGTIDQVLLSILPNRHQSLRMYGLRNKVLIVDEVHAYDVYMDGLLDRLLDFCSHEKIPVILLSATLPEIWKRGLQEKFGNPLISNNSQKYPLATVVGREPEPISPVPGRDRRIRVERLSSEDEALRVLVEAVAAGACGCWIRNTVQDALDAYELLSSSGLSPKLFHARFAMCDRQNIEEDVLRTFGKRGGARERKGQLLIATQVVEQSLDLDFDVLITDLAPIDSVIQRAGRMHRHFRDREGNFIENPSEGETDGRGVPYLYVLSPDPWQVRANWYGSMFQRAKYVYPHEGQLWLSAKRLFENAEIVIPDQSRDLVEAVYSEDPELPSELEAAELDAEGKDKAGKSQAEMNAMMLTRGYRQISSARWETDLRTPTRLKTTPDIRIRLVKHQGDELLPWATSSRHAWSMSELTINANRLGDPPPSEAALYEQAKAGMPDQGRWAAPLILRERNGVWESQRVGEKSDTTFIYDQVRGLTTREE